MRILIITYGSRGDVQPYVALGKGLMAAGHRVLLATSERFQDFVRSHGLEYGFMNDDLLAIIDTPQGKELIENTTNLFEIIRQNIKLSRQVGPMAEAAMRESWEAAREFRPDYILYHAKAGAAPHIAEKLGIDCALATPIPMFVPTSAYPFLVFPSWKLGGWYNRLSYHVINRLHGIFLGRYARKFRDEIGLPALRRLDMLKSANGTDIPVLHAFSEAVLPRPSDWPESAVVTGYWFLDEGEDWEPPDRLRAFLNSGDRPVYIGFGSMAGRHPERLAKIAVEALQRAGLRGIIAKGWGGLQAADLPESILSIDAAPHDYLFPRMAGVVHHGGAGTTAAGLRAGKPSIVVPFFGDQPFWGNRVRELGAGPKPIPQKKLRAERLVVALQEATMNSNIIEAAAEIGRKIRTEDGVAKAVFQIEKWATASISAGSK